MKNNIRRVNTTPSQQSQPETQGNEATQQTTAAQLRNIQGDNTAPAAGQPGNVNQAANMQRNALLDPAVLFESANDTASLTEAMGRIWDNQFIVNNVGTPELLTWVYGAVMNANRDGERFEFTLLPPIEARYQGVVDTIYEELMENDEIGLNLEYLPYDDDQNLIRDNAYTALAETIVITAIHCGYDRISDLLYGTNDTNDTNATLADIPLEQLNLIDAAIRIRDINEPPSIVFLPEDISY